MKTSYSLLIQRHIPAVGSLFLMAAFFCHRLYGVFFPLEGDSKVQLYFRYYKELVRADHNPFQWGYQSYLPFAGLYNPFLPLSNFLAGILTSDPLLESLYSNMIESFLLLWGVSLSVYVVFLKFEFSKSASFIAAILVSYTGFHLVGVREFNHMYLLSLLALPPFIYCFYQIFFHSQLIKWMLWGAFWTGFSLLGSSNVPFFYYVPFALMWSVWLFLRDPNAKVFFKRLSCSLVSIAGGISLAAVSLLPAMELVGDMNRGKLNFLDGIPTLGIGEKLLTMLYRDWWRIEGWHHHEQDYFISLPFLYLALWGAFCLGKKMYHGQRLTPLTSLMGVFLFFGLLATSFSGLPEWLQFPLSWGFEQLSIRYANRLFLLMIIPFAYLAAVGWSEIHLLPKKTHLFVGGIFLLGIGGWVLPNFSYQLVATQKIILLCLVFSLASIVFMYLTQQFSKSSSAVVGFLLCSYLTFALAPNPFTVYEKQYINKPELLSNLPESEKKWGGVLGGGFNYVAYRKPLESLLKEPAYYLQSEDSRVGKVLFELSLSSRGRYHYFAPTTKHRFAFTSSLDPAGNKWLSRLASQLTPATLDMAGVCGEVFSHKGGVFKYQNRPSCLDLFYYVPSHVGFSSDNEILAWMKQAKKEDYLKNIVVNCDQEDCASLPQSVDIRRAISSSSLKVNTNNPRKYKFDATISSPGYLFVSIPYRQGWSAKVSGNLAPVVRANYAYMAIAIKEAGTHKIELTLSNSSTKRAQKLSMASWALWVLLMAVAMRSRRIDI